MDEKVKNQLREIFNKHDPIKIFEDNKTNFDEYDLEIEQLYIRYNKSMSKSVFLNSMYQVFIDMFDLEIAGPKSNYEELAKDAYEVYRKTK